MSNLEIGLYSITIDFSNLSICKSKSVLIPSILSSDQNSAYLCTPYTYPVCSYNFPIVKEKYSLVFFIAGKCRSPPLTMQN